MFPARCFPGTTLDFAQYAMPPAAYSSRIANAGCFKTFCSIALRRSQNQQAAQQACAVSHGALTDHAKTGMRLLSS